jgi:oligopeptide/dipeptide ABC transporter ATP-binding protein
VTLLKVRDLVVRFETGRSVVHAVNGVDLHVETGGTLALVGESGCGKSVTSLAITRLLPRGGRIVQGSIEFDGTDLLSLSERQMRARRGKDIAMVFQDPLSSLNPVLTIGEQVAEAILAHERVTGRKARERSAQLLDRVGIPDATEALSRYPHELSGGMRQRVMIAIAIALQPKLLIADEPTTALDVTIQAQVLELMDQLTREVGVGLILITHDLGVVAGMTNVVAVMYAGFIVETAATDGIFAHPRHPYTVGLLRSLPAADSDERDMRPIEGRPPEQRDAPRGCPFAPRCRWRLDICWDQMPPLAPTEISRLEAGGREEHRIACHNPVWDEEVPLGRPAREDFRPSPATADREDYIATVEVDR